MRAVLVATAVVAAALPVLPAPAALTSGCAPAGVAVDDYRQYEGTGAGTTTFTFAVTVAPAPGCTAVGSVDYVTDPGSAIGTDFVATAGTLTWNGSNATQQVSVTIVRDAVAEPEEFFNVRLVNPHNLVPLRDKARGQIVDDDLPPIETSVDGGKICWRQQGVAEVGVHTNVPAREPITVHYRTIPIGDGKPGYYPVRDGVVTIPVGSTKGVAPVRLITDPSLPDEQFVVEIFSPSAGTLGATKALVTVRSRG
ncbi:Calx-beta domain-containing protein [Actinokineospora enzanensis]|uniref:Calx-beta domain-containing protein n=1 Tax=Actinokineospora enzanensis TaxID=155975 RepID=UPI0007C4F6B2|nr:Calx-beta domain-containing protein [Actinokineospora enzanensis]